MPIYENPNSHPVVVSITSPRISVTVFPASWSTLHMPQGARQTIELDGLLARVFIRVGMLRLKVDGAVAAIATIAPSSSTRTEGVAESADPVEQTPTYPNGQPETSIVDASVEESPASVTEEDVTPDEQAVRASTEAGRLPSRKRPASPPKKQRYAV